MACDKIRCPGMDSRCPRKLKRHPTTFCPMAVIRLKRLRNSEHELTEEEESCLPGCAWAVSHQMSNYCFFKFAAEYLDHPLSDTEVAYFNNLSQATVRRIEKTALEKIRGERIVTELKELHEGSPIVDEWSNDGPYKVR